MLGEIAESLTKASGPKYTSPKLKNRAESFFFLCGKPLGRKVEIKTYKKRGIEMKSRGK